MLQASSYESIDPFLPLLEAIVDSMCENNNRPGVRTVFKHYASLAKFLCREEQPSFWTMDELASLELMVEEFVAAETEIFDAYRASVMGTQKWHCSDYIAKHI